MNPEFLKDIESREWKSIWAGDWTQLDCSDWGEYYTKGLEVAGRPFVDRVVFIFDNGKVSAWVVEEEVKDFSRRAAAEYGANEESVRALVARMNSGTDTALGYLRAHLGEPASASLYDGYFAAIRAYYNGAIPVKYFLEAVAPELVERYLPLLEPARLYGEPVFTESVAFDRAAAEALSKEVGLSPELILCLMKEEFTAVPPEAELRERYASSALIFSPTGRALFVGEDAEKVKKALLPKADEGSVKGAAAYPGRAEGRVRVVLNPTSSTVFEEGEILVTGMTRPEYLPLMEKAAAIVTDAGGILSHAAISAREMKKPCVIGTKVATKVFKDGDIITVDADNGVVQKIS